MEIEYKPSPDFLQNTLQDIHVQISNAKCEIYEALRAFYSQNSTRSIGDAISLAHSWIPTSRNQTSPIQEQLGHLESTLLDTVEKLQQGDSDAHGQLAKSMAEYQRVTSQIESSQSIISILKLLVNLDESLRVADTALENEELVRAAQTVKQMEMDLDRLPAAKDMENLEIRIFRIVSNQVLKCKTRLHVRLSEFMDAMIHFNNDPESDISLVVTTQIQELHTRLPVPISIRDLWEAITLAGLRDSIMTRLTKDIKVKILKPSLSTGASLFPSVESTAEIATLRHMPTKTQPSVMAGTELRYLAESITNILDFIFQKVFYEDKHLMSMFGALAWPVRGGVADMLSEVLHDIVPADKARMKKFEEDAKELLSKLHEHLHGLHYIPEKDKLLSNYFADLNSLYAKKKRMTILTTARNLIKENYMNSVLVQDATERTSLAATVSLEKSKSKNGNGVPGATTRDDSSDGYFCLPKLHVTSCAHKIVEMSHQTMIEACNSDVVSANVLLRTARDVISLFQAVVPNYYNDDIVNDPRICMLFHNDCMYIAHHLLSMGHLYRSRFPAPLNKTVTTVDMAPSYRISGEKALVNICSSISQDLEAMLVNSPPFSRMQEDKQAQEVESCIKAILYKLERLESSWRESLPRVVYNEAMGKIVSRVLNQLLLKIFDKNMTTDAAHHVRILLPLFSRFSDLFESQSEAEKQISNMKKLRQLNEILDMRLNVVTDQYQALLDEFTKDQLDFILNVFFEFEK